MFYLLLGLLLLIALVLVKKWLAESDPAALWKQLRFGGLLIGIALFLFLLFTGRLAWIWAAILWMLPWISRLGFISSILGAFSRKKSPNHSSSGKPQPEGSMTKQRAAEILNIPIDASADEIRRAHKELMKRNHPDQGGSDFLAQMLNQARDTLLGD